jgi:hypothetical protein
VLAEAAPRALSFAAGAPLESATTRPFERKRYGTLVAGVIALLSGFALTAYFVAQGSASQGTAKVKGTNSETPTLTPEIAASVARPIVTPAASSAPGAPPAPPARTPLSDKPRRLIAPKPSAHVAGGLQLSTKEP